MCKLRRDFVITPATTRGNKITEMAAERLVECIEALVFLYKES